MNQNFYHPKPSELVYTFGGQAPVRDLRGGEVVKVYTEDCFGGAVQTEFDLPSQVGQMPYLGPVSGPLFVEGAEPGDALAIHFRSMVPARTWGVSSIFPRFGVGTSTQTAPTLQAPLYERVWRYDIDTVNGTVEFVARDGDFSVDLPLDPMLGTVGVAPAGFQALSTITCDVHGGNMSTPEIRPGTTLYLPVFVHGALLALGNGHARQGQSDAYGVAVETAMHTTLLVEVIKHAAPTTPRIETDQALMSIGCAQPLEVAYRISQHDLVRWASALTGLNLLDSYQLVTQAATARVGSVCDPNYSMVARIRKKYLPGAVAYGGIHARLRTVQEPRSTSTQAGVQ